MLNNIRLGTCDLPKCCASHALVIPKAELVGTSVPGSFNRAGQVLGKRARRIVMAQLVEGWEWFDVPSP